MLTLEEEKEKKYRTMLSAILPFFYKIIMKRYKVHIAFINGVPCDCLNG